MYNETTLAQMVAEGFTARQIDSVGRGVDEVLYRVLSQPLTPTVVLDQRAPRLLRYAAVFIPGSERGTIERTTSFFESERLMTMQSEWRPVLQVMATNRAKALANHPDKVDAAIAYQLVAAVAEGGDTGLVAAVLAWCKLVVRGTAHIETDELAGGFFLG